MGRQVDPGEPPGLEGVDRSHHLSALAQESNVDREFHEEHVDGVTGNQMQPLPFCKGTPAEETFQPRPEVYGLLHLVSHQRIRSQEFLTAKRMVTHDRPNTSITGRRGLTGPSAKPRGSKIL